MYCDRNDSRRVPDPRLPLRPGSWLAVSLIASALFVQPVDASGSVSGGIHIKVRPDGTRYTYNETQRQRARRLSTRLEVPASQLKYLIDLHARRQNLHPRLVQAVIHVESGYNAKARSHKGAIGLMQLMPDTAKLLGVEDPWDPEQNINGGTRYLRQQLDRFSSLSLALAAYNAGPSAVTRHGGIPPYWETRDYVRKVLALVGGLRSAAHPGGPALATLRDRAQQTPEAHRSEGFARRSQRESRAPNGKKVYLSRDENNRIFVTTVPPKSE